MARRRKHRIRDIKFSEQNHSKPGIASVVLAICSWVCFPVMLHLSLKASGESGVRIGAIGCVAILLALLALILAIVGVKDEDTYQFFPKLGLKLVIPCLCVWVLLIIIGIV